MNKKFDNILVIGLGMMGTSLCHSIKKYRLAKEITGYDLDDKAIRYALKNKLIDKSVNKINHIEYSDFIILCSPISTYKSIVNKLVKVIEYKTVLTDIGSSKGEAFKILCKLLKDSNIKYTSSHPMVGSEKSGSNNYIKDMYNDRVTFLINNKFSKNSLGIVKKFWKSIGSVTHDISPEKHNAIMSQTSHIAHILSYMFVKTLPKSLLKENLSLLMGGGIREHIRLSKSDPQMWSDIFIDNRHNIIKSIDKVNKELSSMKKLLTKLNKNKIKTSLRGVQNKTR